MNSITKSVLAEKMGNHFRQIGLSISDSQTRAEEIYELLALMGSDDARVQADEERLGRLQYMIGAVARLAKNNSDELLQTFDEMDMKLRFGLYGRGEPLQFSEEELIELLNDLGYYNEAAIIWNYFQVGEQQQEAIQTLAHELEKGRSSCIEQADTTAKDVRLSIDEREFLANYRKCSKANKKIVRNLALRARKD